MGQAVQQLPLTPEQRITHLELAIKHEHHRNEQLEGEINLLKKRMESLLDGYLTLLNIAGHLAQHNDGL